MVVYGRPQTFFQERVKAYYKIYIYIFLKKIRKIYYFSQPRGGGKGPLLPSPADAHANIIKKTYQKDVVMKFIA